jgi:hypothetical protein
MTPQERRESLLADVWQPSERAVTVADIVDAVGLDAAREVVATLQQAAAEDPILAASYQALATVGLTLSSSQRQALIDQLADGGKWPDNVRAAIKRLGGTWQPRWQAEGYRSEPTLETLVKQQIIEETRTEISVKATAIHAWLDTLDLEAYDTAQLQAYCAALLASGDGNPPVGEG